VTDVALTIAGSDSSGGAGIQADLKTFAAFAVFGTSAITAITAQNTRGVSGVANLDPAFVAAQIDAVADDFTIAAAKTGMLSRNEIIGAVANRIRIRKIPNVVVDPVMVAASGDVLLKPDAITKMRDVMLPLATVVTPNLREASILTGRDVSNRDAMREAAQALVALGARAAVVKGGSPAAIVLAGDVQNQDAIDILYDGHNFREFRAPRVAIGRAHGDGMHVLRRHRGVARAGRISRKCNRRSETVRDPRAPECSTNRSRLAAAQSFGGCIAHVSKEVVRLTR
jgi:hydroxymethylpyrimidine/phosphomethylpyrimidine kinase